MAFAWDGGRMNVANQAIQVPLSNTERVIGAGSRADGPLSFAETWLRLSLGLAWMGLCSGVFVVALLALLPSRAARIRVGNVYGSWSGRGCAWLTGSRFVIKGEEHADPKRPCLYLANHTSLLDVFLGIWLSPTGTCGVGKKEIIYYPFFGQFFWLAGHLTLDRQNRGSAVDALTGLASFVKQHGLSIFVWPEGTRSRDGRLLPFKRGPFHLALATQLPIVPMVIRGAHHAWENRTLRLARATVEIEFLPPIETAGWTRETLDKHIDDVHRVFAAALPAEQRPTPTPSAEATAAH
jgi:1-acyl-sn-glycerol-3-phosphate acyltransferase